MKKMLALAAMLMGVSQHVAALPTGAPVCDVFANYENVSGMQNRTFNSNAGTYQLTTTAQDYAPFEVVEITISGDSFLGLMFTVVDEQGNKVGTFSSDSQVRGCDGEAMAVTHSARLGLTSKTLFWIPPAEPAGTVYIQGYILEGAQGAASDQNFYRFVRDDDSALVIEQRMDMVFEDSFEL